MVFANTENIDSEGTKIVLELFLGIIQQLFKFCWQEVYKEAVPIFHIDVGAYLIVIVFIVRWLVTGYFEWVYF